MVLFDLRCSRSWATKLFIFCLNDSASSSTARSARTLACPRHERRGTQDGIQGIKRHHSGQRMSRLVYKGLGAPVDYS